MGNPKMSELYTAYNRKKILYELIISMVNSKTKFIYVIKNSYILILDLRHDSYFLGTTIRFSQSYSGWCGVERDSPVDCFLHSW